MLKILRGRARVSVARPGAAAGVPAPVAVCGAYFSM